MKRYGGAHPVCVDKGLPRGPGFDIIADKDADASRGDEQPGAKTNA